MWNSWSQFTARCLSFPSVRPVFPGQGGHCFLHSFTALLVKWHEGHLCHLSADVLFWNKEENSLTQVNILWLLYMKREVSQWNVYECSQCHKWMDKNVFTSSAALFFLSFVASFLCFLAFCCFCETVLVTTCSLPSSLSSDDVYNNQQHLQLVAMATWCLAQSLLYQTQLCMHLHQQSTDIAFPFAHHCKVISSTDLK